MTPRRILRVLTRLNIGGPARHVAILSGGLDPARFATVLVTGRPAPEEGDLSGALPPGTRHVTIPAMGRAIHPGRDLVAFIALWRLLWRERPDLLHTHMAKAGAVGRMVGCCYRLLGRRRLVMMHTFHGHVLSGYFAGWQSALFTAIEQFLARHTDVLIAVSESVRDDLLRRGIGRPEQIHVIPLGLDLSSLLSLNGQPEVLRKHLGLSAAIPLLGIVGRLVPIKQHEVFLQAARMLAAQRPEAHFAVVGDGERRAELEALTRALGLEDRVHFVGWQLDLPAVYADLDCVCLTSRNEGTPVSLIEAMAAGRPVVATAVGGVADLLGPVVERGEDYDITERGLLVQCSRTPRGIAAGIARVLSDPSLRARMGSAGRAFTKEHLTAERLLADMTRLYDQRMAHSGQHTAHREGTCVL